MANRVILYVFILFYFTISVYVTSCGPSDSDMDMGPDTTDEIDSAGMQMEDSVMTEEQDSIPMMEDEEVEDSIEVVQAVYVSSEGNDGFFGTMDKPVLTVTRALIVAEANDFDRIFIAEGTYNEEIVLVNGVSIEGGYENDSWEKSNSPTIIQSATIVNAEQIGISGENISEETRIARLTLQVPDQGGEGISRYGLFCNSCPGLVLDSLNIVVGDGGKGTDGEVGEDGAPLEDGEGDPGDGSNGGEGATGGGKGGDGQNRDVGLEGADAEFTDDMHGKGGRGGPFTGGGGMGCSDGDPSSLAPGEDGQNGKEGTKGADGEHSASGVFVSGKWIPGDGTDGEIGENGTGGGGGGAGGGENCFDALAGCLFCGTGRGGGGGGQGGLPGTGGEKGLGGGSSIGIILYQSSGAMVTNCTIVVGDGGEGGIGGAGGIGSDGGTGGPGETSSSDSDGPGGDGGNGGKGGDGGAGGSGAGGNSIGLALFESENVTVSDNVITVSSPGVGPDEAGDGIAQSILEE